MGVVKVAELCEIKVKIWSDSVDVLLNERNVARFYRWYLRENPSVLFELIETLFIDAVATEKE